MSSLSPTLYSPPAKPLTCSRALYIGKIGQGYPAQLRYIRIASFYHSFLKGFFDLPLRID